MSLMKISDISKSTLLFSFVFICFSVPSYASSCCAGSGGQSLCVLPSEQSYQLGASSAYRSIEGRFDPYGQYTANKEGDRIRSIVTVLGAAYRLNHDWQLGLSVPITSNQQSFSGKNHGATSLGDPAFEARYTFLEDLSFLTFRPGLTFYGGVRLPVGKSIYNSTDPYNADAVGDGTTTFHMGLNASKIYSPIKLTFDSAFFYPFSKKVTEMRGDPVSSPYPLKSGNKVQLLESAGYLVNEHWSGTLGVKQLWIFESSLNSEPVLGSAGRLFSSLITLNYFHNASLGLGLTYETAFPFYHYLANQPYVQQISLAATYGGF